MGAVALTVFQMAVKNRHTHSRIKAFIHSRIVLVSKTTTS